MRSTTKDGPTSTMQPTPDGYAHAAEVAGRPAGEIGYLLALVVIAAADIAVFSQVVSILMPEESEWVAWTTVLGFTASSLALAHAVGRIARDQVAGYATAGTKTAWLLAVVWLLLGAAAFTVRLLVAMSSVGSGNKARTEWFEHLSAAFMFLVLYIASGAVAGIGVYFTRNPYRAQYRTAFRTFQKSLKRLARSQPPYERAVNVLGVHTRGRQREKQNFEAAKEQRLAFSDELKRHSAVVIAAHLQNPSATDGMTLPDRRPLPPPDQPENPERQS